MGNFGETLRRLLTASPLQNKEFCQKAGISEDTLYRQLRSATLIVKKSTFRQMAEALSFTPEQLTAAWKDEAADAAAPAIQVQQEKKPMQFPITDVQHLESLSREGLIALRGAVAELIKDRDRREKANARISRPARAAS